MSQKAIMSFKQVSKALTIISKSLEKQGLLKITYYDDFTRYLSAREGQVNVEIDRLGHVLLEEDLKDRSLEDIIESLAVQDDSQVDTVLHAIRTKGLTYDEAIQQVNAYYVGADSGSPQETLSSKVEDALRDQLIGAKDNLKHLTIDQVNSVGLQAW